MQKCPNCKTEINDMETICPNCGEILFDEPIGNQKAKIKVAVDA